MNRELDGCYFRIVRDGVGQSVCFSDLTKEERDALLADKDAQFLKNLCCYLADRIQELGDIIEEQSQQLLLRELEIGRVSGEENGWISSENVRQHFAAGHILLDIQYDPEQNNYIYSFRMSEQKKLDSEKRLQNYGVTLEEAIPNYLQAVMDQKDKDT